MQTDAHYVADLTLGCRNYWRIVSALNVLGRVCVLRLEVTWRALLVGEARGFLRWQVRRTPSR
jgi:hypothetical protein